MDKLRQELSSLHIEKALDIATRDGAFAKEMYAGFGSCKEIVALDRSDKMFEKGREKCAGMPVNFVIGDACHMDFEDNTFDVVGIGNSLHHIPDLAALLEKVFSPAAVERALAGMTDETPFTRAEAAAAINALLELDTAGLANAPYFPDVAPSMENYAAVELAGQSGTISWLSGDRAEPGFLNLDGYLYCVGDDGYFLRDTMVGTLYFDISGRYTSGDDALDTFVADLVDSQTNASMTREEMLRAVYEYVRDHYLYLKRSLYEVGETGWEIPEALLMFQSGKGNCYNFTAAFWSLARGIGFDAVCYSGLVGVGRDPHSWVEITFDGVPYVFDVETEMSYRLVNDYITSMYWKTYEEVAAWSYVRTPGEAAAVPETAG